jgi:hypothetical protein
VVRLEYGEYNTIFLTYYFSEYGINILIIHIIFLQYSLPEYGAVHSVLAYMWGNQNLDAEAVVQKFMIIDVDEENLYGLKMANHQLQPI